MPAKIRHINFTPDEWLAGTAMLDNATRGLYITACALIYSHGGPIELAHLRVICIDHGLAFNRQLRALLSGGKLHQDGAMITNKRAENELRNAGERVENGQRNIGERWKNVRRNGLTLRKSNGLDEQSVILGGNTNHQPLTTIPPKAPHDVQAAINEFLLWYEGYPHKVGKAAAQRAFTAARKLASLDALTLALAKYLADKPADRAWCNPATWLNQQRWLDAPAQLTAPKPRAEITQARWDEMTDAERGQIMPGYIRPT